MWRSNDNLRSWHSHSTLFEVSFSCFALCRAIQACWSLSFQKILLFPPVGVLNHPPSPTFVLTLKDHLILSLLHFINFRACVCLRSGDASPLVETKGNFPDLDLSSPHVRHGDKCLYPVNISLAQDDLILPNSLLAYGPAPSPYLLSPVCGCAHGLHSIV